MKAEMEQFIDLVEGTLSDDQARVLMDKIESDPELKRAYADYCAVMDAEQMLANQQHQISPNFSVKVMQQLEKGEASSFFKRLVMVLRFNKPLTIGALASCLLAVFVLRATRETFFDAPVIVDHSGQQGSVAGVAEKTAGEKKEDLTGRFERDLAKLEAQPQVALAPEEKDIPKQKGDAAQPIEISKNLPQQQVAAVGGSRDQDKKLSEGAYDQGADLASGPNSLNLRDLEAPAKPVAPSARANQQDESNKLSLDESGVSGKIAREPGSQTGTIRVDGNVYSLDQLSGRQKAAAASSAEQLAGSANGPDYRYGSVVNIPPLPASGETYVNPGEAQRLNVTREPVSTFSIDVDTGSYTNARRFIRAGQLPPVDSVRVEEFINYFDYNYPDQTEKPFGVNYEIAPSPLDKGRMLLKLGIKARAAVNSERPWNLIFLIDVSGSMSDSNKLGLVKQALKILVGKMRTNDRIGIVTYAGSSGVALEPTGVGERAKIEQVIDGLAAGGSTYGSGGIEAAYQLAQRSFISEGVNRVILATDGDFNVGITDREQLIRLIEQKRKSGVTLTTIGVGQGNIQEATMEQLANKGNGNYFYLDSFQEARKVFETDLAGTIEVVAKDVKLQVEFNPSVVSSYRLIGYENRALKREDFNNDTVDAGEIGSGHTVTALYELTLVGSNVAGEVDDLRYGAVAPTVSVKTEPVHAEELGYLKIRFKEPNSDASTLSKFPLERVQAKSSFESASLDFRFATAVAGFGQLLRHSSFATGYSYQDIIAMAEAARGEDSHGYRREMIELVRSAALLDKR